MFRTINIGPAALQANLFIGLIGLYIALEFSTRYAKRRGLNEQRLQTSAFLGLIVAIVSARVVYALQHWSAYQDDLSSWVALSPQGMNFLAGVTVWFVTVIVFWRGENLRAVLDALAPGIGVFMMALGLAFLADGSYFGTETDLPWAIDLWGAERHPTQIYAMVGSSMTLILWWLSSRHRQHTGEGFLLIIAGNALTWLLVGLLLAEPTLGPGNYRWVQIATWPILIACAFVWTLWVD